MNDIHPVLFPKGSFFLFFRLHFAIRRYSFSEREVESDNPFFLFPGAEPIAPRSRAVPSPEPSRSLLGAEEVPPRSRGTFCTQEN